MAATPVLVKKPQFLVPPSKPVYPPVAYRRGQQGTVWLEILLSESGKQMQLSVVRSSGFPSLDDAAKVAVADWKLAPYRMNGVAVLSRVQVPVAFVIQ
jgi:protein TonB